MEIKKGTLVYVKKAGGAWKSRLAIVDFRSDLTKRGSEEYSIRFLVPPRSNFKHYLRKREDLVPLAQVNPKFKAPKQILAKYHHLIIPRLIEEACN